MKRSDPSPGRELDALIAEKVMGWKRVKDWEPTQWTTPDAQIKTPRYLPYYSANIAAAWEVVEVMKSKGWRCCVGVTTEGYGCFFTKADGINTSAPYVATAPHAICLAVLKAVGP